MTMKVIRRAQLVKGGDIIKQGETFTLGFRLFDANDRIIQLEEADVVTVKIANKSGVIHETTADKVEDGIEFTVNESIGYGDMRVELTVTNGTSVQKYPARDWIKLQITASLDDAGAGGIQATTANEMFSRINVAQETATTAEQKASAAEATANTVKQGYDDIIADAGDSNPEIVDARRGAATLGNKVDEITTQLADIEKNALFADFDLFSLVYPEGFPVSNIPFTAYRTMENVIQHDYDFDSAEVGAGHIYVNGYAGSNGNDGLTESAPVSTFSDALTKANALTEETVVIHLQENAYDDSRFAPMNFTLQKNIIIKSDAPRGKTFWHTGNRYNSATWIADGTAYKYARSTVTQVFDTAIQDGDLPKRYTKKSSIAEVQAEPGTWYTDGTTVWVRRIDDLVPDKDIALVITRIGTIFNIGTHKLITRDIEFFCEANGDDALSVLSSADAGEYWNKGCVFAGSLTRNGLEVKGVKKTYSFESVATENYLDGFNYHANAVLATNDEFAFEYKCKGYDNGDPAISNSNATTAHDGYTILRLACVGHSTYGPILADVNGCFSVNFDCLMYNSLRSTGAAKVAYYFDSAGAVKQGKAYLINCAGGGVNTLSITGDANLPIYVRNFRGRDVFAGSVINAY